MTYCQRLKGFTFLLVLAPVLLASMAGQAALAQDTMPQENMIQGEFVAPADSFPRVRYFESDKITLNGRCPVRKVPLNPKMTPVFVNGLPIGFC